MNINKRFIAYFDLLGYRNFIKNNDVSKQYEVLSKIHVQIETAINESKKYIEKSIFVVNDLNNEKVNFSNYSDTFIFWTNTDTKEEFDAIFNATIEINHRLNMNFFPVRGVLLYDELIPLNFSSKKTEYHINTYFGKGLIIAHDKAENQEWAGTYIDKSVFEIIELDVDQKNKCVEYDIPLKGGRFSKELAFKICLDNSEDYIRNLKQSVELTFVRNNKWDVKAQTKLNNTLAFLDFLAD
ncbi:MAG: hypothetical protein PHY85_03795 [Bacteroidales bacterium]|nr:hypothetical protein [Bacteroidales bacterium]